MVNKLVLKAQNSDLEIIIGEDGWARCFFSSNKLSQVFLGADEINVILKRLKIWLSFNDEKNEVIGFLEGQKVSWITSLAESHHVLYGSVDSPRKTLFIQNAQDGQPPPNLVARIELTHSDAQNWISQINSTLQE